MKELMILLAATGSLMISGIADLSFLPAEGHPVSISIFKKNKLTGTWDYTVQDVPPEYSSGVLHILKEGRSYKVSVELTEGTLNAADVKTKRNTINFHLMINGQRVDVALMVEGDTISGESTSPDGVFKLQGTRRMVSK